MSSVLRSDAQFDMVYATVPPDALETVATLPFVRWIGPPVYSVRRTGSVTSEGDTVMRADLVRANAWRDGQRGEGGYHLGQSVRSSHIDQ